MNCNKHNNQPVRQRNNTHILAEGVGGGSRGSRRERRMGNKGNRGSGDKDEAKEKSAARFSASFSSGKEVEEPWPLPLLYLEER